MNIKNSNNNNAIEVDVFNYRVSNKSLGSVRLLKTTSYWDFKKQLTNLKQVDLKKSHVIIFKTLHGVCDEVNSVSFNKTKEGLFDLGKGKDGYFIQEK